MFCYFSQFLLSTSLRWKWLMLVSTCCCDNCMKVTEGNVAIGKSYYKNNKFQDGIDVGVD